VRRSGISLLCGTVLGTSASGRTRTSYDLDLGPETVTLAQVLDAGRDGAVFSMVDTGNGVDYTHYGRALPAVCGRCSEEPTTQFRTLLSACLV